MAERVTASEVQEIFKTDITLDPFIIAANQIVNEKLINKGLSDDQLKEIERWLAAHLAATSDRRANSKDMGDASIDYGTKRGLGLNSTTYGQQVKILDTTGIMSNLGKRRTQINVLSEYD